MKRFICALALVLFVSTASLHAQTTNGGIHGTVTDPNGEAVGGADITAQNLDTGLILKTTTTSAGVYSLANLPPGRYSVTVEASGRRRLR